MVAKSGRDKGKKLVVTEVIDNEYVMIADGRRRKIEKPKKKKIKHLQLTNAKKINILSNSQLKKTLGGGVIG